MRVFLSLELTLTFPIVFKPASEVAEEIFYNFMMVREGGARQGGEGTQRIITQGKFESFGQKYSSLGIIVVYRKWDWPRYSVTLVSRDVWINSYEGKVDSLRIAK